MNKKIIGILICTLMIATAIPAVKSLENSAINSTVTSPPLGSMAANWTEKQKLLASDGVADDAFGKSVSLSGDTALIGAPWDDDYGDYSGSAYVFTRTGTTWTQQQKLLASDGTRYDNFGDSVSLDGDTALIGGSGWTASVYVFIRTGTRWTQQAKLTASDGSGDFSGVSVSLDGDTALIGAYADNRGSAYVFTRTGTTWTQQAKLISDAVCDFGNSVSLSGDTALIGAYEDDDGNGVISGSAYVFTRTGTTWTQQQKLQFPASDGTKGEEFGYSVSLSGDTALIGADEDDDNGVGSGSAYVFTRTGTTWTQQQKLLASDGAADDGFGESVSLSGDTALIGATCDDDKAVNSGAAYVFTRTGTTWTQQQKLLASDGTFGDFFGYSVSLSGDTALIGAVGEGDEGRWRGSAYVFVKGNVNHPPNLPTISGEVNGKINVEYTYTSSTTDPDGDQVSYWFNWGDGTNSGWVGPYASGAIGSAKHKWSVKGSYQIKVKARDSYGVESEWSDPLPVTMPVNYQSTPQSNPTAQQSVPTTTTPTSTPTATTSKSLISLLASR